ncbi:hypothetical protein AW736_11565 [Termitidicoccus mucosus]|uniref:Bacterial repeat domain-containing protein n=1 Tax=Termitidicoccus mucosus TaxID=1184151 RepID=A0A178IJK1_9BACT|nr:hypothetical protein AW736_11565 [Opitutaceae bacterium TSB47]
MLTAQSGTLSVSTGGTPTRQFPFNSRISLVASANPGYDFHKFNLLPTSLSLESVSGNTAEFIHKKASTSITATFKKRSDLQTLTVTSGSGGGVVASGSYNTYSDTSLPPADNPVITKSMNVAAGTTEAENFARDTMVRLEAVPAANHAFDGWTSSESLGASGTTSISLTGDKTVTARFRRTASALRMEVWPQAAFDAGARVKVSGAVQSGRVSETTQSSTGSVLVEAVKTGGGPESDRWVFLRWESDWPDINNTTHPSFNVNMNADRSIKAVFAARPKVTIAVAPAGAVGRAYVESDGRTQQDYNANDTATIYAEKTSPGWHFTGFTIATSSTTATVGGAPDGGKLRHQFTVTEDTTVTANFERGVSAQMWVKRVTASQPDSEEDITGINVNDRHNIKGDSYVRHGNSQNLVSMVPPASESFWFQADSSISLSATKVLDYPNGNTYRFVRWRIQNEVSGVWTETTSTSMVYNYTIPAASGSLKFFACYTDERDIQAGVELDGALLSGSVASARGITVKYDNAPLVVGTGTPDNKLQYSGSGRSLVTSSSGGGGGSPAPAPSGAPRAAGGLRSAGAPVALGGPLGAPADDVIFRGWSVTGESKGQPNSIVDLASPSTTLEVRADGSVTARYKSKIVLNVGLKTIPAGATGLTLGEMVSGTNTTTGETLAMGSGATVSLALGRGDTVTLTAQEEKKIGADTYRFAGWDRDGDGVLAEGERTTNRVLNPNTSLPESTVNAFYERMQKLTVDVIPDRNSGRVSIETVPVPPESLPYTDEYGYGRARTLKAEPGTGMRFVQWIVTGSATLSASATTAVNAIAMYSDCEAIAEFEPRPNDLEVQIRLNGGSGSVPSSLKVDADGTQLASGESKTYYYGNNAKVTAIVPPGGAYIFDRWETAAGYSPIKTAPGGAGSVDTRSNPGYVEMLGPQTVIAHYTGVHRLTLNVDTQGGGTGGTVTLDRSTSPLLPRAESGDTYTYYYNDPYGMTAAAAAGYRFIGWRIDDGSGNPPSTVASPRHSGAIRSDLTITAVFAKEYTITFEVTPRIDRIGGWVSKPSAGTTFATYTAYHGERINSVEAAPNVDYGFSFVRWIADAAALDTTGQPVNGSTSSVASLVVTGPHILTANFTQAGREIKIIAQIVVDDVPDTGKASGLGIFANGSTVPGAGTGTTLAHGDEKLYYIGDHATLDASVPLALQDTYVFMAWEEGDVATRELNPLLATKTVTAHYRTKARLTMAISPEGIGTTTPSVGAHPSGADSERDYYVGKVIPTVRTDLRSDTMDFYAFTGWTTVGGAGPQNPDSTSTSVTLDVREKALTANYVAGHKLEVRVKYESEANASQAVQFTTVAGSRTAVSSGGGNSAGIWQSGPQVINYSLRTIPDGEDIEIRAYTNSPSYRFVGWIQNEGDTPSGGPNLVVHMDSAKTYTAVFERVRVQLKVYTIPGGVDGVKAEAVTNAKLVSGEGAEPRVYEVFYGQAPTLQATSTNPDYYFSRWIRGGSYTELRPGETAITANPWSPGALTAGVTEITAYFGAGGSLRTLFLFTEPVANVDIHHVDAPGASSRTYTTMTFADGETRPVCIAYVAVSTIDLYTNIPIRADSTASGMENDHNSSATAEHPDGQTYGFLRWKPERYNHDVSAAGSYLRDLYENNTYIRHPRSAEITGGSLYYTAVYALPGAYSLTLRLELAAHEDGTPVELDPDYANDFKEVSGFNDLVGNINGSTLDPFTGSPLLFVNRSIREKRAIMSSPHTETFSADDEFTSGPYSIYKWTFERPWGNVIGEVTGDSADFSLEGSSPAPRAAARGAAASPFGGPTASPAGGSGWGWGDGGWGRRGQSPAGNSYGIQSGETGESERVTAYVSLLWGKISMTRPVFIQPETWTTTPEVANPGGFTFLRYANTGVPADIFYAKDVSPAPAPYVKQAMRVHGGTPPVLNFASTPANYRAAGWSLDGTTTIAFTQSGFSWASWPSGWPRKVEEDIDVTPVYIRRMQATAVLKVSDEAASGFGNNFNDKVDFMYVGTLDKGTSTLSSTYDYMGGIQLKATPDAAQFHVLEKWIIERAKADGGTTFDPADTEEVIVTDSSQHTLNVTVEYPVRVTAVFGYKKFDFHADVADSLDGAKHGKVMIDGKPAGGDLFVTASSFYSKVHTITAIPDAGYALAPHVGWTVSPSGLSIPADRFAPETTINVEAEKTATAHFERMVTLTMRLTPAELMGSSYAHLTTPTAGVHHTLGGKQLVDTSTVTVAAGVDGDYDFIDWTIEDDNGTRTAAGSSQTLSLLGNTIATANYNRLHEVTLSVDPAPFAEESSARMSSSTYATAPSLTVTANGTATGAKKYRTGAVLNFTATPGAHFTFKHWEIAIDGVPQAPDTSPAMTLTVGAPITAKAVYEPKNYTITVNHASHDMAPPGLNPPMAATLTATHASGFGSDVTRDLLAEGNSVTLPYGTDISLATSPALHYAFLEWTGGVPNPSTAMPLTFKVDGNRTVTAWFQRSHYLLETTVLPNDTSGSITVISGTRSGNPSVHARNEVLKLGVADTAATIFQKWENNTIDRERTVTMNADRSLTATFVKAVYIKIDNDNARGTVTVEGARKKEGDYYVFAEGDPISISANPAEHYDFDRWTFSPAKPADATADDNAALTFTAGDSVDITALFTEKNYSIKVTAQPVAGVTSVTGTQPPSGYHDFLVTDTTSRLYGSPAMMVTVTPKDEPGERYRFDNWDGNSSLPNPTRVWNCDSNVVWVAHLLRQARIVVADPIDITIHAGGEPGGGSVVVAPGEYRVDVGGTLVVTPAPAAGYEFAEWRGLPGTGANVDILTDRLTLAINATNAGEDIVLTPCFRKQTHQVTVRQWNQASGMEVDAGSISLSPTPVSGGNKYNDGTVVTAKVTSVYSGYRFLGWDTDNDPSHMVDVAATADMKYTFTITNGTTLYAVFKPVYRLTLSASPASAGTVAVVGASNASKVDVSPGVYEFDQGTTVTVRATATGSLPFLEWVGDVSSVTSPETTVEMIQDRVVTALFGSLVFHNLTINVSPAGKGTVSASGESTLVTHTRTISRRENTDVVLAAAVTEPGYVFAGWSGDASAASAGALVSIDGPKTVTANFERAIYEITARPQVLGTGTVSGLNVDGRYYYDEEITLTATPAPGYHFVQWITSGEDLTPIGTNAAKLVVKRSQLVLAQFEPDGEGYGVTVYVVGGQLVSKVKISDPDYGEVWEITVRPDQHHSFYRWEGDDSFAYGRLENGDYVCRVYTGDGPKEVTAVFALDAYAATAVASPAHAGSAQIFIEEGTSYINDAGQVVYPAGTKLRFIATEANGDWMFTNWDNLGEIVDDSNPKSVVVRVRDRTITAVAHFDPVPTLHHVTFKMNFIGAPCDQARITMGGATHNRVDGPITKIFREGATVVARCVIQRDDSGRAVPFIIDGWHGLGIHAADPVTESDGSGSTASVTVSSGDLMITVDIRPIGALLQTRTTIAGKPDDGVVSTEGATITMGDQYNIGDEVMVWLTVNPGYRLDDKNVTDDGWSINTYGIMLGGASSVFMEFAVVTPGTFTGASDDATHSHYREYARDADGNYIVPGHNRRLVIKYDPSDDAPRQYGKRVRLNGEITIASSRVIEEGDGPGTGGGAETRYRVESESSNRLDSSRNKSSGFMFHDE